MTNLVVAATTGSIFLLTLNRFVSIVRPLKYPRIMTFKRTVTMIGVSIWLVAILILVVVVVGLMIENKVLRILRYVMAFYIISSIAMYVYMYNLGRKHSKRLKQQMHAITGQTHATSNEFRALTSLFMIAGSFAACWLPVTTAAFFFKQIRRSNSVLSYF
jgi:Ca2+/Na+ antiporter